MPKKKYKYPEGTTNKLVFLNNVAIKIFNKSDNETSNIRDTIASIFATRQQLDKALFILPLKDNNLPSLLSGDFIPPEEDTA